ncbi:MAG: uracil-DNA glycosylase [Tannerella sp.]|jgi:uracil-DNA glycosylase|nr:uracil-DNA glycosylase [Tannerella sp.]
MDVRIEAGWKARLSKEFDEDYFKTLTDFVREEYRHTTIYPPASQIFRAFDLCPFDKVKVVILGQDPYHEPGQAQGLCFSVREGVPYPPSLVNIFKEISDDFGRPAPPHGDLSGWAEQGVLLLNATLTVRAHQAGSHQGHGWEAFTDAAVACLAKEKKHVVYMLWGAYAQRKGAIVDPHCNLVLKSPHPSPLSAHRGFFGNHHFRQANDYLMACGEEPIDWFK